jgi:ubiquitin carboxyl-terminal hydrolase 22/27/51
MYTPAATPIGPTALLATAWRASSDLAGHAQQDAHEALIALLGALHNTSRGSTNVSCICVVHAAFAGALQSEIRCGGRACGQVRTTVDPCLDISLELPAGKEGEGEETLEGCLRR